MHPAPCLLMGKKWYSPHVICAKVQYFHCKIALKILIISLIIDCIAMNKFCITKTILVLQCSNLYTYENKNDENI